MFKKTIASMLAVSVFAASMPVVEAAPFGSSRSSQSASRSKPSPASTYSNKTSNSSKNYGSSRANGSNNASSNKTFGAGQSLGMQRSDINRNVNNGSYRNNLPANNTTVAGANNKNYNNNNNNNNYGNNGGSYNGGSYNNGSYNNGYNQPTVNRGHSTGALIGAAVAGGLVGYMLHRDNSGNTYYTNPSNPNVAYNANGQPIGAIPSGNYQSVGTVDGNGQVVNSMQPNIQTQPAYPQQQKSSFSWFWFLLIVGLIIGLIYFFIKSKGKSKPMFTPFKTPEVKLHDVKEQFFIDFQKNNRPSGLSFIFSKTDPMMHDELRDMLNQNSESKQVSVRSLEAKFLDIKEEGSTHIASVLYNADVVEDGKVFPVSQIWNFKYVNNEWILAGISSPDKNGQF